MRKDLSGFAWLSVWTALVTLGLKAWAYGLTGSVGLFSDALESLVNLAAALLALAMLRWAAQPPDESHSFGHEKAEYLSSGVEGALICTAALGIVAAALPRFWQPVPLQALSAGLALSLLASLLNAITAVILLRAGKRHNSPALTADAQHLLTDCWSSAAVLVGIAGVAVTGHSFFDPLAALCVAGHIAVTGFKILSKAVHGILDASLPPGDLKVIEELLEQHRKKGLDFHALRTRQAGRICFIQFHVLVPGQWTVVQGHDLLETIEAEIRQRFPGARLHTHLEPLEDPCSFEDIDLERGSADAG